MNVKGTYAVKKWEEQMYDQISSDMKLTRASVEFGFSGGIEGRASVEYLMFYRHADSHDQHNSTASYVGLLRFEGGLGGKSGSFVMEDKGTFEGGTARSALRIADGSGTGALKGIRGNGIYRANKDSCQIELDYEI